MPKSWWSTSDGEECRPGEPGELVHRGALVAHGLLERPGENRRTLQALPRASPPEIPITELAVWSGDQVMRDEEGYLYFISRKDEMIKTSGYRVSPTEVEEVVYGSGLVAGAAALGLPHATLGQAIALVASHQDGATDIEQIREQILAHLPPGTAQLHGAAGGDRPRQPAAQPERQNRPAGAGRRIPDHFSG